MRDAYHAKYGRRFWIAPPTLLVDADPRPSHGSQSGRGILIGNISAQEWLDALIRAMGETQLQLDWFSTRKAADTGIGEKASGHSWVRIFACVIRFPSRRSRRNCPATRSRWCRPCPREAHTPTSPCRLSVFPAG